MEMLRTPVRTVTRSSATAGPRRLGRRVLPAVASCARLLGRNRVAEHRVSPARLEALP